MPFRDIRLPSFDPRRKFAGYFQLIFEIILDPFPEPFYLGTWESLNRLFDLLNVAAYDCGYRETRPKFIAVRTKKGMTDET